MEQASRAGLIDQQVIQRLRELFDEGAAAQAFLNDLILTFDAASTESAQAIQSTLAAGDLDRLSQHAHKLKGLSRNIGAMRLGVLCARLETDAAVASPADVGRLCASVLSELKASLGELRDFYYQS